MGQGLQCLPLECEVWSLLCSPARPALRGQGMFSVCLSFLGLYCHHVAQLLAFSRSPVCLITNKILSKTKCNGVILVM